jgi:hypothetical protein
MIKDNITTMKTTTPIKICIGCITLVPDGSLGKSGQEEPGVIRSAKTFFVSVNDNTTMQINHNITILNFSINILL